MIADPHSGQTPLTLPVRSYAHVGQHPGGGRRELRSAEAIVTIVAAVTSDQYGNVTP